MQSCSGDITSFEDTNVVTVVDQNFVADNCLSFCLCKYRRAAHSMVTEPTASASADAAAIYVVYNGRKLVVSLPAPAPVSKDAALQAQADEKDETEDGAATVGLSEEGITWYRRVICEGVPSTLIHFAPLVLASCPLPPVLSLL
jgi:hypothetical protein